MFPDLSKSSGCIVYFFCLKLEDVKSLFCVWGIPNTEKKRFSHPNAQQKKYSIHPELLDKSGNITEEELLTVRFSNDNDSTLEEKGSTTD